MKKLRLLLWPTCNRNCAGCCNKQWDLNALPLYRLPSPDIPLSSYDEILLTGGEPMQYPDRLREILKQIPRGIRSFVYTAKVDNRDAALEVLHWADGMTVTLHEQSDLEPFMRFAEAVCQLQGLRGKSLRLNVFAEVDGARDLWRFPVSFWKIKEGITWIENSPLPQGETFMRLG